MVHPIDSAAGLLLRLGFRSSRVFPDGWGDQDIVRELLDPSRPVDPVVEIDIVWGRKEEHPGFRVRRGQFTSPAAGRLPLAARAVPVEWREPSAGSQRTVVILPAWNDHGFDQRRRLADLLIGHNISSVMFDIPLYGARRMVGPRLQAIRTVADFALMGFGAVHEARSLMSLFATQSLVGVSGFSMGGNLSALVSAQTEKPIATAALAASHSPGPVYLDGVLNLAIDWDALGGRGQADRLRRVLTGASALSYQPFEHHRSAIVVAALRDGFVPLSASTELAEHWDAELRTIPGGHATALWRHRATMAKTISDSFDRLEKASA